MRWIVILLLPFLLVRAGIAQDTDSGAIPEMKQQGSMTMGPGMQSQTFQEEISGHATSGTSAEPDSVSVPMLMTMNGNWMLMFHASVFALEERQSSPRGGGKLFSTNWFMPMAQREFGRGTLTLRTMLSLEPATVTGREYPLLLQQGETAYGRPIADGQHPHNFVMEFGALYDVRISNKTLLSFYAAPVGDPAIGPIAYPHRASASEDPVATLGHHQEDSTHVASDVVTMGVAHGILRLEAGGFHGREPDEHRWQVQQGAVDSWAARLTVQPGKNWSGQYSYGHITSPEALYPTEDQERMTASVMYNHQLAHGSWANSVIWGRTRSLQEDTIYNSYLLESTLRFHTREAIWTRMENVDRSTELLLGENPLPPNFQEQPVGRVQAYTFGYDHDFYTIPHVAAALGGQVTVYSVGSRLEAVYGSDPMGAAVFIRFRPR